MPGPSKTLSPDVEPRNDIYNISFSVKIVLNRAPEGPHLHEWGNKGSRLISLVK